MSWNEDQEWEKDWWGNCQSTGYAERTKQLDTYAPRMNLDLRYDSQGAHVYTSGKILDIGGGPVSLLLIAEGWDKAVVVDPCDYPEWTEVRYKNMNISLFKEQGERILQIPEIADEIFDEVWIYNVLQHVDDPCKVISNAKKVSKLIRVFDWLDIGVTPGHPHNLTESEMNAWLGGVGKVVARERGKEYFGIFLGNHFEK